MADTPRRQLYERLADALQQAALGADALRRTADQQRIDVSIVLGGLERAVEALRAARDAEKGGA